MSDGEEEHRIGGASLCFVCFLNNKVNWFIQDLKCMCLRN